MNIQSVSTSLPPLRSNGTSSLPHEAKGVAPPSPPSIEEPEQSAQPVGSDQLQAAIESVREYIEPINRNLEFSVNEDIHKVVIKVVDKETKELIRQIPSEEMIAIAKALDSIKGLFIKQQA